MATGLTPRRSSTAGPQSLPLTHPCGWTCRRLSHNLFHECCLNIIIIIPCTRPGIACTPLVLAHLLRASNTGMQCTPSCSSERVCQACWVRDECVPACRYAHMLQLAHDAIQRHQMQPAMLYISLDQVYNCDPQLRCASQPFVLQVLCPF